MTQKKQTLFQITDYSLGLRDVLSFVVALTFFLGIVFMYKYTQDTQVDDLKDMKVTMKEFASKQDEANQRLARIEGTLGIKPSAMNTSVPAPPIQQTAMPTPLPTVPPIALTMNATQQQTPPESGESAQIMPILQPKEQPTPAPTPQPTQKIICLLEVCL